METSVIYRMFVSSLTFVLLTSIRAEVSSDPNSCEDPYPELSTNKTCFTRSTCPKPGHPLMETSALMNGGILGRNCMCDRLCVVYGDCCDVIYKLIDARREPWMESHLDLPSLPKGSFSCISYSMKYMYEVNKCPSEWDNVGDIFTKEQCESNDVLPNDTFIRWPVSDNYGIMYRNMFCAQCHQVPHFLYWKIEIECNQFIGHTMVRSKEDLYKLLEDNGLCSKKFKPPSSLQIPYRPCKHVVDKCAYDWVNDSCKTREKCEDGPHSYVYQHVFQNPIYKNKYCAKCNFESVLACIDEPPLLKSSIFSFSYPLSIIFDINTGSEGVSGNVGHLKEFINETSSEMKSCSDGKVFDPFIRKCRSVSCKKGYILKGEECILAVRISPGHDPATDFGYTDCIRITLNQSEFVIFENGSLFLLESTDVHPLGSYDITVEGLALVCTNFTQNYTLTSTQEISLKFSQAQTILTVIGQIISLVALLIQFVVYLLFPKLRNLAGKNLMCLVLALFCGQLFFLVSSTAQGNYSSCASMAIITHFAFIASFAWMNIMSYDIWKTFANTSKAQALDHQGRRFLKYSAFGWGGSFCLIIIAVIVNFTISDTVYRPGYGETICWIRYRLALLIFFAAPVALVVFTNLVFYTLTIISIWKISKLTKAVTKKSDKNRLWLYIKLSSIMGLTWIFGFVAAIFDSQTLWYFFIIFNSLQGAFICISFVFTKQVYHLMRDKFRPVYMALSTTATTSITVSESQRLSKVPMTHGTRNSDDDLDKGKLTSEA